MMPPKPQPQRSQSTGQPQPARSPTVPPSSAAHQSQSHQLELQQLQQQQLQLQMAQSQQKTPLYQVSLGTGSAKLSANAAAPQAVGVKRLAHSQGQGGSPGVTPATVHLHTLQQQQQQQQHHQLLGESLRGEYKKVMTEIGRLEPHKKQLDEKGVSTGMGAQPEAMLDLQQTTDRLQELYTRKKNIETHYQQLSDQIKQQMQQQAAAFQFQQQQQSVRASPNLAAPAATTPASSSLGIVGPAPAQPVTFAASPVTTVQQETRPAGTIQVVKQEASLTQSPCTPQQGTSSQLPQKPGPMKPAPTIGAMQETFAPIRVADLMAVQQIHTSRKATADNPPKGQSILDLVKLVDPSMAITQEVEEALLLIADRFIESTTRFACSLANHRGSGMLQAGDLVLHLARNHSMPQPGHPSHRTISRRLPTTEAHRRRMVLLRRAANAGGRAD